MKTDFTVTIQSCVLQCAQWSVWTQASAVLPSCEKGQRSKRFQECQQIRRNKNGFEYSMNLQAKLTSERYPTEECTRTLFNTRTEMIGNVRKQVGQLCLRNFRRTQNLVDIVAKEGVGQSCLELVHSRSCLDRKNGREFHSQNSQV